MGRSALRQNSSQRLSRSPPRLPLLDAKLTARDPSTCPFGNAPLQLTVNTGEIVWLRGASGAGKTTACLHILGLHPAPGTLAKVRWDPKVPASERAGMLFQQGVLVDALSVGDNLRLGLAAAPTTTKASPGEAVTKASVASVAAAAATHKKTSSSSVASLLSAVGLSPQDAQKMPGQLSGGMLRRAALAQLLSQRKRLIVLDEPFTGLDMASASGIVRQLRALRTSGTAFILISHQETLARQLEPDTVIEVVPKLHIDNDNNNISTNHKSDPNVSSGLAYRKRLQSKATDYLFYSLPLIALAFLAAGLAISMLFAEVLTGTDVGKRVLRVLDDEFADAKGMLKSIAPVIRAKAASVIERYAPAAKRSLFGTGMARLFVLEVGPLLTALLLAGRVGGAYAGEVATMQATNQNRLLRTLGVDPRRWTLLPAAVAALLAAPLLTLCGTYTALQAGAFVVEAYELGGADDYWSHVSEAIWVSDAPWPSWPPLVLLYRSAAFMTAILAVAEVAARSDPRLQPRGVPSVITAAVVAAGLAIILMDWAFSQLLLHYGLGGNGDV